MHLAIFLGESSLTADSAVLTVFETSKNIDFQGGIPTFKYKTKMRHGL